MSFNQDNELFRVTKEIVLAHVSHNQVRAESLPDVIRSVHQALVDIRSTPATATGELGAAAPSHSVMAAASPYVAPAEVAAPEQAAMATAPSPDVETAAAASPQEAPVAAPQVAETPASLMVQPEDQPTEDAPVAEAAPTEAASKKKKTAEPLKPAVPIEESVQPDYIICLEDGKKFKMMKRYLKATYGMTPEDYRKKWGLPDDYPMAAPAYSASKSAYAKMAGLGTSRMRARRKAA